MTKEEAITLMRGAACSKTALSRINTAMTEAEVLKMVRHYVKALPANAVLGDMVTARVLHVTHNRRKHS